MFLSAVAGGKWDHVYCTCGDVIARQLGKPMSGFRRDPRQVIETLMMRINAAYPASTIAGRGKDRLADWMIGRNPIDRLHFLDPISWRHFVQTNSASDRAFLMPEVTEPLSVTDRSQACEILGLRADARYVTCPGTIQDRKGIRELTRAFQASEVPDTHLVLIGKQTESMSDFFRQECQSLIKSGQLILSDRYVDPIEFDCLFTIADLVCVPYPRHLGSASILVRAAQSNRRILASQWGWIGWATNQFGLGRTCDVTNANDFSETLHSCLVDPDQIDAVSPLQEAFSRFHTRENHVAHWTAELCRRHGLPQRARIDFPNAMVEG
ncbi:hypothetical protein Poly51_53730 [Rubripirellula tenax]|uniref:Uncharacterized protein n=2 Tax=Rubripirellula tenax TaxID=2528015 RepID=A0A5C6ECV4_9BACT|nr:hypothetical protein Poly51_53730 [Rubripirellula tenax]